MIDDIRRHLAEYQSAVLTIVGIDRRPVSIRIVPSAAESHLDLGELPSWFNAAPGRAGLLCHRHDQNLWNQHSFIVGGDLVATDGGNWTLVPDRLVIGLGHGGLLGMLRMAAKARRRSIKYFQDRGQPVPIAPWEQLAAIKKGMRN